VLLPLTKWAEAASCVSSGTPEAIISILFEPARIGNLELQNRFLRSATYDALADRSGHVSEKQIQLHEDLADGGVGLIVAGIAYVHFLGSLSPYQNSIASDDCIDGYRTLTDAVHGRDCKIALQLFHAGREAARRLRKRGEKALAPSFVPDDPFFQEDHRAMTEEEIWEIVRAFGDAAMRAREAGFDAVQVHAAHAYLGSQFLSPATNRRDDDWGGSLENRIRFHREVYRDIGKKVGQDFPVFIKIGVEDGFSRALRFAEGGVAARVLAEEGFDALEISQGLRGKRYDEYEFRPGINSLEQEGYFRDWCKEVKGQVGVPTIMVGGLRTFELMEEVVQTGEADFVALSRPLIREPGLVKEWKAGSQRRPACISCNQCFEVLLRGDTLYCPQQADDAKAL
jgi:2,4-dienoyl-CoA reductase-like NADH-dependent reductase (Old Yellow Enzyme family)